MVQINSSELLSEIRSGAKIEQLSEAIPNTLANQVVPVMEVNPKLLNRSGKTIANSGLNTTPLALTIPNITSRRTFITGAWINYQSDVLATATSIRIRYTPFEGAEQILVNLNKLTLAVGQDGMTISFPVPIRAAPIAPYIDIVGGVAAGTLSVSGGISYYQENFDV
jgi:hypothetical protein